MMTEFDHFDDNATEKTHMHMHANRETRRQNKDALHDFLDIHQFPYLSLANYIPIQPTLFMLDVMLLLTRYLRKIHQKI